MLATHPFRLSIGRVFVEFIISSGQFARMKKHRGFTLVELVITIAVAAILMAVAVPSFQQMIQDHRTVSQASDLMGALTLARSEAVTRGSNVTIAPASGSSYANGWKVTTVDSGGNTLTLVEREASDQFASGPSTAIVFNSTGQASGATAPITFSLRPPSCASGEKRQRTLSLASTGRASISATTCP